jgi:hypothetical protein
MSVIVPKATTRSINLILQQIANSARSCTEIAIIVVVGDGNMF